MCNYMIALPQQEEPTVDTHMINDIFATARRRCATKEVYENIRQVTPDLHNEPASLQVGVNQGVAVSSHQACHGKVPPCHKGST